MYLFLQKKTQEKKTHKKTHKKNPTKKLGNKHSFELNRFHFKGLLVKLLTFENKLQFQFLSADISDSSSSSSSSEESEEDYRVYMEEVLAKPPTESSQVICNTLGTYVSNVFITS